MIVWLWYRKGSFALKEQFTCMRSATTRAEMLKPAVGVVEIFANEAGCQRAANQLRGAIEVNPVSDRLLL